jgi:hypothetical protein
MSVTARVRTDATQRDDIVDAMDRAVRGLTAGFEALFVAALPAQDAPRAWSANNCLLAKTRWARPNRLNSLCLVLGQALVANRTRHWQSCVETWSFRAVVRCAHAWMCHAGCDELISDSLWRKTR